MLDRNELFKLAKLAASADKTSPVAYSFGEESFSYSDLNEALRTELNELAGTYSLYRENKNTIFALMEQTIDEVLPRRVDQQYGQFADVMTVAQGDKPVFNQRISNASRLRAKQFVSKVGLAGVYEVFKLDGYKVEIETMAYGGAAQIGLEEFLDGRITFADVLDIVMLALDEAVYKEIAAALIASTTSLADANTHVGAGFNESAMDRLVQIADVYGPSSIYCTYEFAATMLPASGSTHRWSGTMADTVWDTGYLANYKGHRVIVLPQSFTDDTNATKVIDPAYAWVIPGGAGKPVKIAFEGQTITREYENRDGSREVQIYKKIGVGTVITNNICSYKNTSLSTTWTDLDEG